MSAWDEIKKKCPRLYRQRIHFECGEGWAPLIFDLSLKIEKILSKMAEDGDSSTTAMYAVQVKEKYGTLRFYMSLQTDEMTDLIDEAEAASSQTCEQCGALGKMRNRNREWVNVSCEKCFKNHQEDLYDRGKSNSCC